ncbi:hypothetical protein FQR65_LT04146 [Abscondita terminalis]|nr:hypothetical protein FQR65_LT04146 [Abscondita terminalis]
METKLYINITDKQWPIIYRPEYNVHFFGLEKLHPFDAKKWGSIFQFLKKAELINESTIATPNEVTEDDLLVVHSKKYIRSLQCSFNVAKIAEVPPLVFVPNFVVQRGFLKRMRILRYQTGGSVLAGKLALERGWAINIGGGFHHCSSGTGGGFCVYADISLLIHFLFIHYPLSVQNVMIIDLDAHQVNERHTQQQNVYILDVYNKNIYPFDREAKRGISRRVELHPYTRDEEYLHNIEKNIDEALDEFLPDLVVYNAGTDVLEGDPLGCLGISPQGIILRDEIVFKKVRSKKIPIVMLTSGGYLKNTAKIIATSILNLHDLKLIEGPVSRY